jgi:hypothetical protein
LGIKEKLPLINSSSKGIRIVGYVLYGFVFLIVLGMILPSQDEEISVDSDSDTGLDENEAAQSPDQNWTSQVLVTGTLVYLLEKDGSNAVGAYDSVAATQAYSRLKSTAEDALEESSASNVSETYLQAKTLYESGLQKYVSASSTMLKGIRATNENKALKYIGDATSRFMDADGVMAATESELNRVDPNWAGDEE